jgi:hypothetical protein
MATLKLPVFWSSRKLTSLRGTSASALPPLTIFHLLSALQRWPNCTQEGLVQRQSRRCCIPAQHRRARMTRPPTLPPCLLRASARRSKFCSCSCRRCCLAGGGGRGGGPLHPGQPHSARGKWLQPLASTKLQHAHAQWTPTRLAVARAM